MAYKSMRVDSSFYDFIDLLSKETGKTKIQLTKEIVYIIKDYYYLKEREEKKKFLLFK